MPNFTPRQRFRIALGGFISFIGFIILVMAALVITETIDIENILQHNLLAGVMAIIGILDLLAGVLLLRLI